MGSAARSSGNDRRAKRTLTVAAIERLKPPTTGQRDHFDSAYPGLALRLSHGGRKAWTYFYRLNGKQRRLTLGTYPALGLKEVRDRWRDAREQIENGIDPAAVKAETANTEPSTVRAIGDKFVEKWHRPRNRTAGEIARMFELHVYPEIGDRDIGDVTRHHILDLLDKASERGASVRANRVLANVRRLFGWAVERGYIESSPVVGIKAPAPETARDRILDDEELRAFLKACDGMGEPFGPLFRLLLLTAQRRDEVAGAAWSEIDSGDRTWHLAGGRTKNGRAHDVPLSSQAFALIERLPSKDERGLLFPAQFRRASGETEDGGDEETPRAVSGYSRAKRQLDAAMLAELRHMAEARGYEPSDAALPPWRLHDLRRTAASGMARLGIAVHVVEALLNHKSGTVSGIAAVYNRYDYAAEKRAAAQAWADFIDRLAFAPCE